MTSHEAALRGALRLHLAPLSPRQRALLREAGAADAESRAALASVSEARVDGEIALCRKLGVRLVLPGDPLWPPLLSEIPDPPAILWVRGELPDPAILPLAIVGPRRATPYGLALAERFASELAALGAVIVSGGARGVDAAAHRAALDAGAPTVAVLGCGVDVTYPPRHGALYAEIAARGAVVSEMPCGTPPLPHHFPVRNRILAGWSRAVLVVEATLQSGSRITARLANELGRDVLAAPGPVTSPLSEGTNELIACGARLLRGVEDVRAVLRPDEQPLLRARARGGGDASVAGADGDPVLAALPLGDARPFDDLAQATRLPIGALLARLAVLDSQGLVECLEGGLWRRRGTIP